ncbi:MAG: glycoside hydrolase family 65 protein [Anaerolineae bacterium]|nr:glycoside hydrolase family 65 protein [Anaerolineae bacterium]
MNPHERAWTLCQSRFEPDRLHYYESIMTVGNGYLGSRASFEEGHPAELPGTLVHGIFNHHPQDQVPDLANLPCWFALRLEVDGEPFRLDLGHLRGFERRLSLRDGVLRREVLWQSSGGKVIRLAFERFASMADRHVLAQRVSVTALTPVDSLTCVAYLDESRARNVANTASGPVSVSHWEATETGAIDRWGAWWQGRTNRSGHQVRFAQRLEIDRPATDLESHLSPPEPGNGFSGLALSTGDTVTITKIVAVGTSRDADDLQSLVHGRLQAAAAKGYDRLLEEHRQAWTHLWEEADIRLEGDDYAQLALRFATYHLLIAAPFQDERVSIGARTLSGPCYKGHVFWDTEIFMLPPLTLWRPDVARNLLLYRYHTLPGAREKAKEAGYEGAMFAWESTDTGLETTPRWTLPDRQGRRIRIWTGDNEQHISADVAYGVWQYWQWTGDDHFMRDFGAEIILDTAVFWGSRVEWNHEDGCFELTGQIGPDEYHENVDNPVFTNRMVVWHLEHALKLVEWLRAEAPSQARELGSRLGLDRRRLSHWREIVQKMRIPFDAERGVLEQFPGFFELAPVPVELFRPRTACMDAIIGHGGVNASQVLKQADVVMLIALLGERLGDREALRRNWDTYVPRTAHDSSLSPAVHAWVAARLDLPEEAYRFWLQAAGIDLEDSMGNAGLGVHAATCGGLIQAVIFGFAGLHLDQQGGWGLDPCLPEWWQSLEFTFHHRGRRQRVRLANPASA